MEYNFRFDSISDALPTLAKRVMETGDEVGSRGGRVNELTHVGVALKAPWDREILSPGRGANLAAQIAETMWVLSGRDDVAWLANYLPRATEFSDDGQTWRGAYGKRLRAWPRRNGDSNDVIDQLAYVIDLLREDPLTRRAVIAIYDPETDSAPGKDIPCNNWLHFTSRLGKLDLHVTIRSNDLIWGWSGINAFEWSALQEIVASILGVEMGSLHFSITSLHIYERHFKKARGITQPNPQIEQPVGVSYDPIRRTLEGFDELAWEWFRIEELIRLGDPYGDLVRNFPEPMLRSWLEVIEWWWGDRGIDSLQPRLAEAAKVAVQPRRPMVPATSQKPDFLEFVCQLHREKHEAYGDSWKRRGELIGIMANIARKIDRLGVAGAGDTSADTAIDLLVYLVKYRLWIQDQENGTSLSDGHEAVTEALHVLQATRVEDPYTSTPSRITYLKGAFSDLEYVVMHHKDQRMNVLDGMIPQARALAALLWAEENRASNS